ncbi:MAG: adenosylcobinamide amidohydrolase [Acidimicrobiales bacterium]
MKHELRWRMEDGRRLGLLVWRFPSTMLAISSAPLGGGLGRRDWVVNGQVAIAYDRPDADRHLVELAGGAGLEGDGIGLLTAAEVPAVQVAVDRGAHVAVTVGLTHPTWAAASDDDPNPAPVGTINLVAFLPERLTDAALVNAVATVTEAKTQALWECGVEGTGTATDAVAILCPVSGSAAPFGGPRSLWGSRLARAARAAVSVGTEACLGDAGR